ncbi:hypothetical protein [Ramlibacter alkalitolerans]|uniref:Flagellar hook-length control protein-like C-terminal domain-containing protein n=1 Tax=Ramlibacter alkalitolerans TaxID=2039631 RepID=A0ABS1JT06_9BURK|nr:hypothetical protein [Ramlibacter alkalitolerans]MBL0427388.1 hypothetical protein [Ramlibacter alkalitolerans]
MKLPLLDLPNAIAAPPAAALAARAAHGMLWQLHLQRAASSLEAAEPAQRPQDRGRDDEGRDLESCGGPVVPGEPATPRPHPVSSQTACEPEPLPPSGGRERESERALVRLHVQVVPAQGVKVWLGIDGDATLVAQRAAVAVADLRRGLHSSGERISSLVCNGVPLDPQAPSSAAPLARTPSPFLKESPWP